MNLDKTTNLQYYAIVISMRGSAWQSAAFGTQRPQVQILSHRFLAGVLEAFKLKGFQSFLLIWKHIGEYLQEQRENKNSHRYLPLPESVKTDFQEQKLLESSYQICYIINIKTTAHKGLTSTKIQQCHPSTRQSIRVVLLCKATYKN